MVLEELEMIFFFTGSGKLVLAVYGTKRGLLLRVILDFVLLTFKPQFLT